jgi:hypothetical protein
MTNKRIEIPEHKWSNPVSAGQARFLYSLTGYNLWPVVKAGTAGFKRASDAIDLAVRGDRRAATEIVAELGAERTRRADNLDAGVQGAPKPKGTKRRRAAAPKLGRVVRKMWSPRPAAPVPAEPERMDVAAPEPSPEPSSAVSTPAKAENAVAPPSADVSAPSGDEIASAFAGW